MELITDRLLLRPYRKISVETGMGEKEETILNLLVNPDKDIKLEFSHPETLIWKN